MKHATRMWFMLFFSLLIVLPAIAQQEDPVTDHPVITVENASQVVELAQISPGTINSASYSPDGSTLAIGGVGGIWLYEADHLDNAPRLIAAVDEVRYRYEAPVIYEVLDMAFSPDGTRIASAATDGTARLWDVISREQIVIVDGHTERAYTVAFSPDGTQVISGSDLGALVWDAADGEILASLGTHRGQIVRATIGHARVNDAVFSPDGTFVVMASGGTVRVWNLVNGEQVTYLDEKHHRVLSVTFSPDGARIMIATDSSTIRVLDAETGERLFAIEDAGHHAVFSPDGSLIASANDRTIGLWDAGKGQPLAAMQGHTARVNRINRIAFNRDGTRMISTSDDAIRFWGVR